MSRGLKITFLIHAIVAFIFGILLYLIPTMVAGWINWTPVDPTTGRFFGAALLALALSSWLGSLVTHWEEVRIVLQTEIAFTILGVLAGLYEALCSAAPTFLWVPILILALFAVAWIYFYRAVSVSAGHPAAA